MNRTPMSVAALLVLLSAAGCARVSVEGGEKPIHIVLDVNVRIARELDNFFAFEDQHPAINAGAGQPTTSTTTLSRP